MKFPWFRVYSRMVDDESLNLLAFEDRWHFVALLCLKGEGLLDRGDKPELLMRKVAVKMGIDTRTLDEVARRLAEVGLICRNTLIPVSWDALQQRSDADSTAAERKRRQRQREREEQDVASKANAAAQLAANADRQDENDAVTDMSRVTCHEVTRTDIDKEEDRELQLTKEVVEGGQSDKNAPHAPPLAPAPTTPPEPPEPPEPPAPPAAPPKEKEKRAARLPDDWVLPKSWGDWAIEHYPAMTPDAVRKEAEVFADYWHAEGGQKARKLDWLATWRNWVRRANERKPNAARPGTAQQSTKYAGAAAAIYDGVNL